ncbi:unnamed protein product [Parascedosporium putredinis]|uniref:Apple domain-containing protein n=1 Tax=Parascedosporium putredinis TaxID=1442378 RepID=A0A9P1GZ39_9PEZI|nr:unnamed protein product [Parascedosporium putredinis]CAI7992454.1 unnamed protein product [Parascedosporium putredinis]
MHSKTLVNLLFVAAASASNKRSLDVSLACQDPSPHCLALSEREIDECRQLISKRHIEIATCQVSADTVASTLTVYPTNIETVTVLGAAATETVTETTVTTDEATTPLTVTITTTLTEVETTNVSDISTTTEVKAITNTVVEGTDTVTNTVVSNVVVTSTVPWVRTTCAAPGKKKRAITFGACKGTLPGTCSCLLTATETPEPVSAVVTETELAAAVTVTVTDGNEPVSTETVTVTVNTDGEALPTPSATEVVTVTETHTDVTSIAVTVEQIETAVATVREQATIVVLSASVSTVTVSQGPCDNFQSLMLPGGQSYVGTGLAFPAAMIGVAAGEAGQKACCEHCFNNPGCVVFRLAGQSCNLFQGFTNPSAPCTTEQCPNGFPMLPISPSDGWTYFAGQCLGYSGSF